MPTLPQTWSDQPLGLFTSRLDARFPPIANIEDAGDNVRMSNPTRSLGQVYDGSSLYWGFYAPDQRQGGEELIEVRLSGSPEAVKGFVPPAGWTINRTQWGDTLFLRRQQSIERDAVEQMLVEMLRLTAKTGLRFHSWLHGADIDA